MDFSCWDGTLFSLGQGMLDATAVWHTLDRRLQRAVGLFQETAHLELGHKALGAVSPTTHPKPLFPLNTEQDTFYDLL